jgi:hypothetical protein
MPDLSPSSMAERASAATRRRSRQPTLGQHGQDGHPAYGEQHAQNLSKLVGLTFADVSDEQHPQSFRPTQAPSRLNNGEASRPNIWWA